MPLGPPQQPFESYSHMIHQQNPHPHPAISISTSAPGGLISNAVVATSAAGPVAPAVVPPTPALPQAPAPAGKKKSPHFRWRRRKRRSKAQYPEMGQYLVPIDEGDEIQHLGRTLECTLCGLRGKRSVVDGDSHNTANSISETRSSPEFLQF